MKLLVSTRGPCWAVAGQDRHFASQPHGVELNHPCGLTVDGTSPSASMCPSPSRVRLRQRTAPSRSEDALIRGGHPGTRCMTRLTVTGNECRRRVVVMKTTVGDIELELWAKETAKAYGNFIQLCMEGYWDDTIFHRIIKGFITQDGDPTGTGEGGKIYGEPFKDDFHTRLRSCRRDLIAVANAGKMTMVSNTSLFLILHQICRINIQSLVELLVNLYINDKPLYPPRLIKPIILNNPFSDIIPRIIVQECEEVKDSSETQTAGVKYKSYMFAEFSPGRVILCYEKFCYRHFNLLSFGKEAEEDEEESVILNKKFTGKDKSAHDHLTDPKLSSQPAVEPPGLANKRRKEGRSSDWENDDEVKTQEELEFVKKEKEAVRERIRNTLRDTKKEPKKVQNYEIDDVEDDKGIKENE
ncbi:Peptidyl-prolyl cis-trans isomerase CWC27 like protein [Eufriesea mexicana]|uniref:Spliceosome-associated protein CWC27 homolog n=1 Tax=Eufriesea mexicana TaxID=516756 RepID=A0A310SF48_9HYME|nr:Peptidyl-prolyl cis-trans isomerase CWC27 like protein [Eufriesea mexicana]